MPSASHASLILPCAAAILATACASHPRGRSGADQAAGNVADAAKLTAASMLAHGGGVPLHGSVSPRAGARHVARLEIFVSGMTCPRLARESVALRITDLTDRAVVAEGLPVRMDWKVAGEVRLLRGPHELALLDVTKNRVIASRQLDYDGTAAWRGALEVPCDERSVSYLLPVAARSGGAGTTEAPEASMAFTR